MKLPKLILSDLDGTLLPESKVLSARSREALGRMAALGVTLGLASGKFYHLTCAYGRQLPGSTAVIALDGARTATDSRSRAHASHAIPYQTALGLLEYFRASGLDLFVDSGDDEMLLQFAAGQVPLFSQLWANRTRRVDDARPHLIGDSAILAFYGPREALQQALPEVEQRFPGLRAALFTSEIAGTWRLVVQRKGVTKGAGMLELCGWLGIEPAECLVFGDWFNDLPMFQAGGVNVAMANAQPELKALAHHVTEHDCEADGVADFLEKTFLS